MCSFRSGIIFKDKTIIAQGDNDSHTTLLEELNIEDNTTNAMTLFVRAELLPPDREWWTDPETWRFHVDQDILPDWFTEDKGKYEAMFRETVKAWWEKHVLVNEKVEKLNSGFYMVKDCHIKKLAGDAYIWRMYNSQVGEMHGNSRIGFVFAESSVGTMSGSSRVDYICNYNQIDIMKDNSRVEKMEDYSQVGLMSDSSCVGKMFNRSRIVYMSDSSRVEEMLDYSQVEEMGSNSRIEVMRENSQVDEMYNSHVGMMFGNSRVREMGGFSQIVMMRDYSRVDLMNGCSQIKEMFGHSQVNEMLSKSMIDEIHDEGLVCRIPTESEKNACKVNALFDNAIVIIRDDRGIGEIRKAEKN